MKTNTKNMGPVISTGERKCSTIGLKYMAWHSMHLL